MDNSSSCIMVIFGGTGDLTHRKLLPAIYNLKQNGLLPENFAAVAVGRQDKTHDEYRREAGESVQIFSRQKPDSSVWESIREHLYYYRLDFAESAGYAGLRAFLNSLDQKYKTDGNRLYYLAVAPGFFELITARLREAGMADNRESWQRLVIEKPFGTDLQSASYLNEKITAVFPEKNIFRIDHYLGKEMIQNIMVIRFANLLFESVWNHRYIDNIQITSSETVGVESRAGYYDKAGALRDMLQNHLLQLLTLIAMEPPVNLEAESIRNEKVKVLTSLKIFTPHSVGRDVVRGQYGPGAADHTALAGYRQEGRVSPHSGTETFIALKTYVENFRWGNMPFYLRTGKRMPEHTTEIVIQFKDIPNILYAKNPGGLIPNRLVITIQPAECIYFSFNAKRPGMLSEIKNIQMNFCQNRSTEFNSPEAYERLLYDIMRGDSALFTRWDEVEHSWRFVDTIAEVWNTAEPDFPNYAAGSWGPAESGLLLERDGRQWWNPGE